MGYLPGLDLDLFMAWSDGDATGPESLELFAQLVNTGYAWQLEGHIGREAARLIEQGLLIQDPDEERGICMPNPDFLENMEED